MYFSLGYLRIYDNNNIWVGVGSIYKSINYMEYKMKSYQVFSMGSRASDHVGGRNP